MQHQKFSPEIERFMNDIGLDDFPLLFVIRRSRRENVVTTQAQRTLVRAAGRVSHVQVSKSASLQKIHCALTA